MRLPEPQSPGGCAWERAKPETEVKKQPWRKGRGQGSGNAAAVFPGGPTQMPPAVKVGADCQARATRTALWEEGAAPGGELGLEVPSGQPGCHGHRDKERG